MIARIIRNFGRCESGAAAVEFAIISMVLISLCIAVVDFGRSLYVKNQLSFLADQATRTVLVNPSITNAQLQATLEGDFNAGDANDLTINIDTQTVGSVDFRVIVISYPMTLFIPNLSSKSISLDVTRRVPT
ncbi:MAG: TadE/TadG family type IV pilus assembly protein [Paracoccaceae bacterium]